MTRPGIIALVWIASVMATTAQAQYQLRDPSTGAETGPEEVEETEPPEATEPEEEPADEPEAAEPEAAEPEAAEPEAAEPEATTEAENDADTEVASASADGANPAEGQTTRFGPPNPPMREGDFQLVLPPLFMHQRSEGVTTTAVFPGFYLRESLESSELVIPPLYHREGAEPFDVVFPVFWWLRGEGHHTWIAGPVFHHEDATSHDLGVAPLFASGRHEDRYYHLIPPLLTAAWGSRDEDYLTAGLLGYRFRRADTENWGLFPLLWVRNSPTEEYQFVAPLFWRWRNAELDRTLVVAGPVYHQQDRNESFFGFAGLLHHAEGEGFHSTTIPPLLFHISESHDAFRLSTPAFLYMRDGGDETFVSWLYQRHRGATEFDGVLPLFFHQRDPREQSEFLMASPLVWHWASPGSDNWAVVPFFLRMEEAGRSSLWLTPLAGQFTNRVLGDETLWIFPTIQSSRWHDGSAFNVHPIWYSEDVPSHHFTVFNPLWWDFEQREQRTRYSVLFPLYYRVVEGNSESQVTLPLFSYFRRRQWVNEGRWEWELHLGLLFDYGERSDGEHWWRVLYGLAGWEHRIGHDRLWLLYMPVDFRNDANAIVPVGHEPALSIPETPMTVLEAGRF